MRRNVNKGKAARKFRGQTSKTHVKNVARPGRGGFRL